MPHQPIPPADLLRYSDNPPTPDEWRRWRYNMSIIDDLNEERERLAPLLKSYEAGMAAGRVFAIIGAWVIGTAVGLLGIMTALKTLNFWPFGGT